MHGPTCIFWANLTPVSLKADRLRAKNASYRLLTLAYGAGGVYFLLQLFDPKVVALRLAQVGKTPRRPINWANFSPL